MNTKDYFESVIPKAIEANTDKIKSIGGTFQFDIGDFKYTLNCGEGTIAEGASDGADCTIICSEEDFAEIAQGKMSGMQAFSMGKLKVTGNLPLSLKLQDLISMAQDHM